MPRYARHSSLRTSDLLCDLRSGSWFACGAIQGEHRDIAFNPGLRPFETGQLAAPKFADVESAFGAWARRVAELRKTFEEWPTEVSSRKKALLVTATRRELNAIAKALKTENISLETAVWEDSDTNLEVKLSFGGENYTARFSPSNVGATCELRPGRDRSHESVTVKTISEFRTLADQWARSVRDEMSVEHASLPQSKPVTLISRPRLKALKLTNIRGFEDFNWQASDDGLSSAMIIGANGTGKSTILRCVALAMLPQAQAQTLLSTPMARMLRDSEQEGTVEVRLSAEGETLSFIAKIRGQPDGSELIETLGTPSERALVRVYAYGSGRNTDGTVNLRDDPKIRAVSSLFRYNVPMVDSETALLRLRSARPDLAVWLIDSFKRSMKLEDFSISADARGAYQVFHGGTEFPLSSWADGYRLTLQWFLDLWLAAFLQSELASDPPMPCGILLIDELELNLHPKLQVELMQQLKAAFPLLTLVGTTHSPILALGVEPDELIVLKREKNTIAWHLAPRMTGMTIDDITSDPELFDATIYPPQRQREIDRWKELMNKSADCLSPEERLELSRLTQTLLTT